MLITNQIENKKSKQDLMNISVTNSGPHAPCTYYYLFYQTCESDPELLKGLLKKREEVLEPKPIVFTLI